MCPKPHLSWVCKLTPARDATERARDCLRWTPSEAIARAFRRSSSAPSTVIRLVPQLSCAERMHAVIIRMVSQFVEAVHSVVVSVCCIKQACWSHSFHLRLSQNPDDGQMVVPVNSRVPDPPGSLIRYAALRRVRFSHCKWLRI